MWNAQRLVSFRVLEVASMMTPSLSVATIGGEAPSCAGYEQARRSRLLRIPLLAANQAGEERVGLRSPAARMPARSRLGVRSSLGESARFDPSLGNIVATLLAWSTGLLSRRRPYLIVADRGVSPPIALRARRLSRVVVPSTDFRGKVWQTALAARPVP